MTKGKSVVNKHQPSLSEWFAEIGHADADMLREEDKGKRDRLEILRKAIGLDYDRVTAFSAVDFYSRGSHVEEFISSHLKDLCALRLVPTEPGLPKMRTRGRTLEETLPWLLEHDIGLEKYNVEFVEHSNEARWSTIFVVREDGVYGEVVDGLHFQLTQGNIDDKHKSRAFLKTSEGEWQWSEFDEEVQAHMEDILSQILVSNSETRDRLKQELNSEFTSDGTLAGYFETLLWPTKLIFIDYNRELHKILEPPKLISDTDSEAVVKGVPACAGEARGAVRLVYEDNLGSTEFNDGDILVTDNTDVRYLPLMRKAGAIVTDRGGMLSHAAITARELKIPCIVGCKNATMRLSDGDEVVVDAAKGVVILSTENK